MASVPTAVAGNASSKDGDVRFSNHGARDLRVASITTTTITVDSVLGLTGTSLYSSTNPGLLQIVSGVASSDKGKTANITAISGTTITVDVDFTNGVATDSLEDGSIVKVIPPHAIALRTNGGHSLQVTADNEVTKGHTDYFLTHNTPATQVTVGGGISSYVPQDTQGAARLFAWFFGQYKLSGTGVHDFVFAEDDDGTYDDSSFATLYSKEGNAAKEQVFGNLFATSFTLNAQANQPITFDVQSAGNVHSAEIGGTGKDYPTGASNYVVAALPTDSSSRMVAPGVYVEFGGTFGDALTDSRQTRVTSLTINGEKESDTDTMALGNAFPVQGLDFGADFTMELTRIIDDDSALEFMTGSSADASGLKTETRVLVHVIAPTSTKSITFDIPKAVVTVTDDRSRGRATETLSIRAIHTLDSNEQLDLTKPLVRARITNLVNSSVLTTLA